MPVIEKIKLATDKNVVDLKADLIKKIADGLSGKADLTYVNEKLAGGTPKVFPELDFYYQNPSKELIVSDLDGECYFIIRTINKNNTSIQSKYSEYGSIITLYNIYPGNEYLLEVHYFKEDTGYLGTNFKLYKAPAETKVTPLDHFTVHNYNGASILKYIGNDEKILVPKMHDLRDKFGTSVVCSLDKLFVPFEKDGTTITPNKTARDISFVYDETDSFDWRIKSEFVDNVASEFINNFPNIEYLDLRNIMRKEYIGVPDIFIANCPKLKSVLMNDKTKIFLQNDFSELSNTKKLVSNCPKLESGKFFENFISTSGMISGIDNIPAVKDMQLTGICFSKLSDNKITNENFKLLENSPNVKIFFNRIDVTIAQKIRDNKNWDNGRMQYSLEYPPNYPYEEWINIDMKKYLEYLNYKDKKRDGREWRI